MAHVLIAVDFDDASHRAIDLGKELAKGLGADVTLVHVYHLPIYTYPGLEPTLLPGFTQEVTGAARHALEKLAAEVGVSRAILREGDPTTEILATAEDVGASMIVVGTHGRRGLSHVLLGSVAEKVVRSSRVPVLTVRVPAS
jgi:nucleotide-binding universal stress UspA family protein